MTEEREFPSGGSGTERPQPRSEETVGEMLLAARERCGMSLDQISQETKIPVPTLRHLETDSFEALPARVYVKGFLRTYAAALGLDPQQLLSKYEVQSGQTHHSRGDLWEIEEQTVEEKLPAVRLVRRFFIPALLIVIVVLVLVRLFGGRETVRPSIGAPDTPSVVPAAQPDVAPPEDAGAPALPAADPPPRGEAPGAAAGAPTRDVAPPTATTEPASMELRIVAQKTDTTWFDLVVFNRRGSVLDSLPRDFILYPGQTRSFRSNESFFFRTIGNAGGFTLELDGKPLPPLGERGRVRKNVRVTRAGIAGT